MSRRPGVGVPGLDGVVPFFGTPGGLDYMARELDVPSSVRIGGSHLPIGRTLKRHFRSRLGVEDDVPLRTLRRELRYRVEQLDKDAVRRKEIRRVARYERAKARLRSARSVL